MERCLWTRGIKQKPKDMFGWMHKAFIKHHSNEFRQILVLVCLTTLSLKPLETLICHSKGKFLYLKSSSELKIYVYNNLMVTIYFVSRISLHDFRILFPQANTPQQDSNQEIKSVYAWDSNNPPPPPQTNRTRDTSQK